MVESILSKFNRIKFFDNNNKKNFVNESFKQLKDFEIENTIFEI